MDGGGRRGDAAAEGVWWIEPAFDADRYSDARPDARGYQLFDTQEEGWAFTLAAAEAASKTTGVGIGFISAIDRSRPVEQGLARAQATAALVRKDAHQIMCGADSVTGHHPGIVAIGLHGPEEGFPPEPFVEPTSPSFKALLDLCAIWRWQSGRVQKKRQEDGG